VCVPHAQQIFVNKNQLDLIIDKHEFRETMGSIGFLACGGAFLTSSWMGYGHEHAQWLLVSAFVFAAGAGVSSSIHKTIKNDLDNLKRLREFGGLVVLGNGKTYCLVEDSQQIESVPTKEELLVLIEDIEKSVNKLSHNLSELKKNIKDEQ
jgi:hypothetical protein